MVKVTVLLKREKIQRFKLSLFMCLIQVSKYQIDIDDLKDRFKQIAGFHFVSSKTMVGIDDLAKEIIETTLQQKYIGEFIPEVYLNFEKNVKIESQKNSLITYDRIIEIAELSNMYDKEEILEAVKFLNGIFPFTYIIATT
jgi:leucine-rich repeat kinase 2